MPIMPIHPSLESRLRRWILLAASHLGYFRLFAFLNRKKIVVLVYHGVTAREAFSGIENYRGKHVRAPLFREHLAFLEKRYKVLPLPDVLHAMRTGAALPHYTAVITFDDGYENNVTAALPVLREAGVSAAFFLSTGYIGTGESLWTNQIEEVLNDQGKDQLFVRFGLERKTVPLAADEDREEAATLIRWFCNQLPNGEKDTWLRAFFAENAIDPPKATGDHRFMSWDQARELHAAGMTVGSHTVSHAIVTRLTTAEMRREIAEARACCEEQLGVPCEAFSYPGGRKGDYDDASKDLLRKLGFSSGFTAIHGLNRPDADPFELRRMYIDDNTSVYELEAHMSGFTSFARGFRHAVLG